MNEGLTLDGLAAPLRVLRLLTVDFGHLPAPQIDVSTVYPDQLGLRFHDDLSAFEAWRDALGIVPDSVVYREQGAGRTRVLKASTEYAGAVLELTGYGDVHAPAPVGAPA
ncbi:hypothetical protein G9272_25240 [Streptomyces asoensis]|uniref:Uncharacterized protein n=1 Tax=Streptomyces asoensis TaxID=249586 RepID=A0A6M4WRI9_9ACTN|nr:hypothetical protein [Streptomyces asoensis]QJT03177.1 hypothetical protein G9272_25240 [Streptomyces asoensis]